MEVIGIRHEDSYNMPDLPELDYEEVSDPRLQRAMSAAMETKQITPILKEELRLSILSRRLAAGKDEIQANFPQPKSYDLTPAEIEKRRKRKEQNKMAARKHRRKSKSKSDDLMQELEKEQKRKEQLEEEYARLTNEKTELLSKLIVQHDGHAVSCEHCEGKIGCEPIKCQLCISGTITINSSLFTVIEWAGLQETTTPTLSNFISDVH